jgi:hypothetical protein
MSKSIISPVKRKGTKAKKVKKAEQSSYVILKWIDEAPYRCYSKLFRDKETAMKYAIRESDSHNDMDLSPEGKMTFQEKYDLFVEKELYPPSLEDECGCYYFELEELPITESENFATKK